MKAPSLSPAAAGAFFINHGEKFGLGVIGLLALLMMWWGASAAQSQGVDRSRTPDAIESLARQAGTAIEATPTVPLELVPEVRPFAPRIDPWRAEQVKLADAPARPFVLNPPTSSELTKRTKPQVFPIEDLRAVAGMAVFVDPNATARQDMGPLQPAVPAPKPTKKATPGRSGTSGQNQEPSFGAGGMEGMPQPEIAAAGSMPAGKIAPFVIVTGLIPSGKQQAEFARLFSSVSFRDPNRDTPRWTEYIVERSQVVSGENPAWKRLRLVNVARLNAGTVGGAGPAPDGAALHAENLPKGFFLQSDEAEIEYAAALPARFDGPWGEESLHPWFIPELRELLDKGLAGVVEKEPAIDAKLADLVKKPKEFLGKELRLTGVVLDPESKAQPNAQLHRFGVRSADDSVIVPQASIGENEKLVFATSEEFGKGLAFDLGLEDGKKRRCNLLVRIDQVGKTPVARILEVDLVGKDDEVLDTRKDSAPEPVTAGDDLGFRGAGPQGPDGTVNAPRAENRLFRFVDLGVTPGAEYRYRVRFAIRNPNVNLAPQHVAKVADTKGDFLLADFSPESPTVRVPDPVRILARTMTREAAKTLKVRDDNIEVIVMAESDTNGNYALRSIVTTPGGSANVDTALNRPSDRRHFGDPVITDRLLVDVRGGQEDRTASRNQQPAEPLELLILKPDGDFDIVSAADSELFFEKYRSTLFPPGEDVPYGAKPVKPPKPARPPKP